MLREYLQSREGAEFNTRILLLMFEFDEDHLAAALTANDYYFESSKALLVAAILSRQEDFLHVYYCYYVQSTLVQLQIEDIKSKPKVYTI